MSLLDIQKKQMDDVIKKRQAYIDSPNALPRFKNMYQIQIPRINELYNKLNDIDNQIQILQQKINTLPKSKDTQMLKNGMQIQINHLKSIKSKNSTEFQQLLKQPIENSNTVANFIDIPVLSTGIPNYILILLLIIVLVLLALVFIKKYSSKKNVLKSKKNI
jgi:hypothetical protein